ncbi:TPA: 1-acylglycerol-3-phosphate O-acyltransferase [Pasteurella multocida]|uniref:1-acyl-sn-glycerol-3-phosphate acyltransferase n=1 Tax=Pasteurella multocida TaxID=747 RepID=A0A849CLL9_PASMD|nr:1-acylglycerol-3-phosphate O-acyltransferase [Pasteurella multocida]AFI46354.1 1-acyl-sn-glycerol-3-phosphate acyltransferase [Pasteurella multocida subsp. multocida str. 3480]AWW53789.1 1-acylglycerol-3-phosphate O-acyltransferase [Pasteurella multocida]EPE73055.1 1-acyl-sn-glycerol-3-phosphate acyltransferase [Pasteurella multocida 671/90]MCH1906958.1 1-acylglycerol-3-phosphate O-acyltransferase [Pasteurella multocida]MCL7769010.1 1-acylglycerol-3-phosphate O-acyltransferase [Pasteurella 
MLKLLRTIVIVFCCLLICVLGSIYSFIRFRNPSNVGIMARWFGRLHPLFGLTVEHRFPKDVDKFGRCIYIGNHQNNYDMVTISYMVQPRTVSVGKKSLIWIPFFGLLYWVTGNILIDRENRTKAHGTMNEVARRIHDDDLSVWMFPEGTRSRGRGLLPFKTGAFYAAIAAGVPIVPVVCSTTQGKIDLNRWDNGKVICEMLEPIDVSAYDKENVRELAAHCHQLMAQRIAELDAEIAQQSK